jgi:hypothetical protein
MRGAADPSEREAPQQRDSNNKPVAEGAIPEATADATQDKTPQEASADYFEVDGHSVILLLTTSK